jgi:hypothetical protein
MSEVLSGYDYPKEVETTVPEPLGLSGQQPTKGILTIDQIEAFVESRKELENGALAKAGFFKKPAFFVLLFPPTRTRPSENGA